MPFSQVELILEQMRLCLLKKDYVRTQIISKKISVKFFDKPEVDELKLKFYKWVKMSEDKYCLPMKSRLFHNLLAVI